MDGFFRRPDGTWSYATSERAINQPRGSTFVPWNEAPDAWKTQFVSQGGTRGGGGFVPVGPGSGPGMGNPGPLDAARTALPDIHSSPNPGVPTTMNQTSESGGGGGGFGNDVWDFLSKNWDKIAAGVLTAKGAYDAWQDGKKADNLNEEATQGYREQSAMARELFDDARPIRKRANTELLGSMDRIGGMLGPPDLSGLQDRRNPFRQNFSYSLPGSGASGAPTGNTGVDLPIGPPPGVGGGTRPTRRPADLPGAGGRPAGLLMPPPASGTDRRGRLRTIGPPARRPGTFRE